jgi:hypothetical protein
VHAANTRAATEIRGGQAAGIASCTWARIEGSGGNDLQPLTHRVRAVARKRHPLAIDIIELYKREQWKVRVAVLCVAATDLQCAAVALETARQYCCYVCSYAMLVVDAVHACAHRS